jgi:hypothetical protein
VRAESEEGCGGAGGGAHKVSGAGPEEGQIVALWGRLSPELREVVCALPDLPEPILKAIVAMVDASKVQK